ncbi:gliding motility-associated C-terminal domain-containing protein [Pedobacter chinensis]|uniref:Gliding motility-associated C-terminal domain-containing protein n=1 Tax=Pedobacter chinensis TaxID=2282421 RepID=A0A369Q159_9SPHI|nr:gliding motility-associated C-terminal domain-containing protein [Pedobacter chinensis]RDC58242.1 gliding motility-associated C-terminal domain-containing protein [Pedobacter chinensis]
MGRTIKLLSVLPAVSSNLTIDASTQPGNVFGLSTARVQLVTSFTLPNGFFGLDLFNVNDVAIYGLYIRNLLPNSANGLVVYRQGIAIRNCKNIKIGAAGKGNVISGFEDDLGLNINLAGGQIQYHSEDLSIKANFIGVEADGVTFSTIASIPLSLSYNNGQIDIGGTLQEGNFLPKGLSIYQINSENYTDPGSEMYTLPAVINIKNNIIGTDISGSKGTAGAIGLSISSMVPGGKNTIDIEDNVIFSEGYGIRIINSGRRINLKRNYIGTDRSLTKKLSLSVGIFLYYGDDVKIGGDSFADANFIANCKPVSIWPFSKAVVTKNSFFCTNDAYPMIFDTYGTRYITTIQILSVTTSSVAGKSTPNSVIELFYSDACGTCSPETYFGSTIADANGNWQYNGPIAGSVIASATFNGFTSEFTRTAIDVTNIKVVHTCNDKGSIIGAIPSGAANVKWFDEQNNVVGTDANLLNVPVGKYRLQAFNGDCDAITSYYEVKKSLVLNTTNLTVSNTSCGDLNGKIRGLSVTNNTNSPIIYSWKDAGGTEVSQTIDLNNVKAGSYTLTFKTSDNSCSDTYGPVNLINTIGPNINESAMTVNPSACQTNTGSIKDITVFGTGNINFKWKNEAGTVVGTSLLLINQPAGKYILELTDNSGCGAITSSVITIPETNGISLLDLGVAKPATCGNNNGAITGITVTGATYFEWFDSQNKLVATTSVPTLTNVPAGDYYVVASNQTCFKKSKIYTIHDLQNTTLYTTTQIESKNASCGLANGFIKLTFGTPLPVSYRWVNKKNGQTLGTNSSILNGMFEGIYQLYVADENNCEKLYSAYEVKRDQEITIDDESATISNAYCGLANGSITGIKVSGTMPFTYEWKDAVGKTVGNNLSIGNLKSGKYELSITDASSCLKKYSYTILDQSKAISAPSIEELKLCGPGTFVLSVNNPISANSYRLYDKISSMVPLDDQPSGKFTITVKEDITYYVSQYNGTCESPKKEVKIKLGLNGIEIPTAFSPNDDGINDFWVIKGAESYPIFNVKLFNRNGAKVFESPHYKNTFNGMVNGKPLAVGVYYYLININDGCSSISGSLTILR